MVSVNANNVKIAKYVQINWSDRIYIGLWLDISLHTRNVKNLLYVQDVQWVPQYQDLPVGFDMS